ncbi:MAG TPA: tetratricopeptide repeat protein [Rheinheimera sp.]|nr:tetratricopeptide repeat protein [Rheinheimera sp.]
MPVPEELLTDIAFAGSTIQPETTEQIFALPETTELELSRIVTNTQSIEERTKAALKLIFSYAKDGLLYDNMSTKTASETVASGKANCLSLSILAYSMAKELGMTATFQDIQIPEYWTTAYRQTWLNGHINVRLKQHRVSKEFSGMVVLGSDFVVDFDPYSLKQQFPEKSIEIATVVAMFYNNKAAVAFAQGDHAKAYAYYKAAAKTDPNFSVTWSNLGVLYRVNNMLDLAELSYKHSLALEPDATNTLANLAVLYRQTGNSSEARSLEKRVLAKRNSNPYYFLMLGNEAYRNHDYHDAITNYESAVALDDRNHEAYFGLAISYYALHDSTQATRYMKKARRNAPSNEDQQRYEHKLAILNQIASLH